MVPEDLMMRLQEKENELKEFQRIIEVGGSFFFRGSPSFAVFLSCRFFLYGLLVGSEIPRPTRWLDGAETLVNDGIKLPTRNR